VELLAALQSWTDTNLQVITAGSLAPDPTQLLGSAKMGEVLDQLKRLADVVILDGPPFLVTDAWVLSSRVDGVILVIRPGHTHRDAVKTVMEQINRGGARAVGVTLNRIPAKQAEYYGGYWYISPYHAGRRYGYIGDNGRSGVRRRPDGTRRLFGGLLGGARKRSKIAPLTEGLLPTPSARVPAAALMGPQPAGDGLPPESDRDRAALDLLYAISHELAAQSDLRDLLQRVLRLTLETVGASSGSIMVLDEKGEVLEGVVAYAGKVRLQDAENLTETVERGLAGWVISHRQAALIPSTRDDPRWLNRSWDESDNASRSAISVPLIARDRVIGVLTLVHPQEGRFTEEDLSLLTAIGTYVSLSSASLLVPSLG
jgi:putative methionine-R-sulfoxide reductase with GAF domain